MDRPHLQDPIPLNIGVADNSFKVFKKPNNGKKQVLQDQTGWRINTLGKFVILNKINIEFS